LIIFQGRFSDCDNDKSRQSFTFGGLFGVVMFFCYVHHTPFTEWFPYHSVFFCTKIFGCFVAGLETVLPRLTACLVVGLFFAFS
jgi:hypothetical protein